MFTPAWAKETTSAGSNHPSPNCAESEITSFPALRLRENIGKRNEIPEGRRLGIELFDLAAHHPVQRIVNKLRHPAFLQVRSPAHLVIDETLHEKVEQGRRHHFDLTVGKPMEDAFVGKRTELQKDLSHHPYFRIVALFFGSPDRNPGLPSPVKVFSPCVSPARINGLARSRYRSFNAFARPFSTSRTTVAW